MKLVDRRCGTCKWWDRDAAKDKAGRVRADWGAECQWPVPKLPSSTRQSGIALWPMTRNGGTACPCWEARS
jgi:hypothetical protein